MRSAAQGVALTYVEADSADVRDTAEIDINVPADGAYLSVLRTAAAGLAARLNFTLDDIEDLRIAVDEACSILLAQAVPDSRLTCSFHMTEDSVTVRAGVRAASPRIPSRDGFAWAVLSALASRVEFDVRAPDQLLIELSHQRPGNDSR